MKYYNYRKWPSQGFELGPCHMIQICLTCSTTEPTGNVAGWIVRHIDSASNDNCDSNNNHATTMAPTTRRGWPPRHATWLDGRYTPTRQVNFVVTTVIVLLSPFGVTWSRGPYPPLACLPQQRAFNLMSRPSLPTPLTTRPPHSTTRPQTKWGPHRCPGWTCQGRGLQKRW